jgi:hypothetical protein
MYKKNNTKLLTKELFQYHLKIRSPHNIVNNRSKLDLKQFHGILRFQLYQQSYQRLQILVLANHVTLPYNYITLRKILLINLRCLLYNQ